MNFVIELISIRICKPSVRPQRRSLSNREHLSAVG